MTTKKDIVAHIQALMREHDVTLEDISRAEGAGRHAGTALLYAMCAGVTLAAIAYALLLGQLWDTLPALGRVVASLGGSLVVLGLAAAMQNSVRLPQAFALWVLALGAVTLPEGIYVTLYEGGMASGSLTVGVASLVTLGAYGTLYAFWRTWVLPLLMLLVIPVAYFALLDALVAGDNVGVACVVLGALYVALLVAVRKVFPHPGVAAFGLMLGTALILGGMWDALDGNDLLFVVVYPFLVSAATYAGFVSKRMAVTAVGLIAAIGYLGWITDKYFADSIGWPLALLLLGLVIGAGGYLVLTQAHGGKPPYGTPE